MKKKLLKSLQFMRLFIGGLIGSVVMVLIIYQTSLMWHLKPNLIGLIEFGTEHFDIVAHYAYLSVLGFFIFGSIILPIVYGIIIILVPNNKFFNMSWLTGICFSLILWVVFEAGLIPTLISVLKFDSLTSEIGSFKTAVVCLLGYIGYGLGLGLISGKKENFKI